MESNKEKWQKLLKEWKENGISRTEFCRKREIPVSTFDYWRSRIQKEAAVNEDTKLVQLPVKLESKKQSFFILEFPSGLNLNIPERFKRDELRDLISIIKGL